MMAKRTARRDYGSGSVYQRSSDGRWIGSVEIGWERRPDGKYVRRRKKVSGKTKADVVEKLRKIDRLTATTNVPYLADWLHEWMERRNRAPMTMKSDRSNIERHIIPHLGRYKLDALKPQHILRWHDTLRAQPKARGSGTMTESAVLRAHAVLSRALEDAYRLERGWLPEGNPARRVDRPGRGHPDVTWLGVEQATALLRHVEDDPMGSRWAFALLTGQRRGEVLGLRRSHIDLDVGVADVSWQLQAVGYRHGCPSIDPCGRRFGGDCPARVLDIAAGREYLQLEGALCLTRPKAGVRKAVPLADPLVQMLRRHIDATDAGPHDLVWHRHGRPIDPRQDYDAWMTLLDEAGLPRVKPHSMRHTCATLLLSLGVNPETIRQMVGHNTEAAARSYLHMDLTSARAAASKLASALQVGEVREIPPAPLESLAE